MLKNKVYLCVSVCLFVPLWFCFTVKPPWECFKLFLRRIQKPSQEILTLKNNDPSFEILILFFYLKIMIEYFRLFSCASRGISDSCKKNSTFNPFVMAWPFKDSTLKLLVFVGKIRKATTVTSEPKNNYLSHRIMDSFPRIL